MMREGMWMRLARRSVQSLLLCLPMAAFAAEATDEPPRASMMAAPRV